jgi:hypothetical protein
MSLSTILPCLLVLRSHRNIVLDILSTYPPYIHQSNLLEIIPSDISERLHPLTKMTSPRTVGGVGERLRLPCTICLALL